MKDTVVLYTWIAMGHLLPMVEFSKLLSSHGMSVTVVIVNLTPNTSSFTSKLLSNLSAANPNIAFHVIPSNGPEAVDVNDVFSKIEQANSPLSYLLQSMSETCSVHALVIDFFCTYALDVAHQLDIPAFIFYCSGAYDLAMNIHYPILEKTLDKDIVEMGNKLLHFPGLPPIPASHLPNHLYKRDSRECRTLVYHYDRISKSDGILVNTFESMEKKAVEALEAGLCLPGRYTPPIYCIGPLVTGPKKEEEKHECLTWLDMQPKDSVVFLSFGSMGSFSQEQLKEIGNGLEKSCQRFLWVVRSPEITSPLKKLDAQAAPDLHKILPEGFIDRTKDRGLVVKQWAPQVEVLNHDSVGAFITHCGWNSILEATMAGVPMICWPMYAEQKMNKIFLVEEMKVAVEMKGYDEDLVPANEVEDKVRLVMDSEEGNVIRERMESMKAKAEEALREGGSSHTALMKFLKEVRVNKDGVY